MDWSQQAIRFGGSGIANTLVGLACIFLAKAGGVGDVPANLFGYGVGLAFSFILNRQWTFANRGAFVPQAFRFLIAFGVAYCTNLVTVLALRDLLGLNSYLAQLLGVVPYSVVFFVLSRCFVFKECEHDPR